MNQPGLGVMIRTLAGRDGSDGQALDAAKGQTITRAWLDNEANDGDGALRIALADGRTLTLTDVGRSCCESRYMTCDDDLATFAGASLRDIELREGPDAEDDENEAHETMFVHVITDKGTIVVTTHNEHNGYYGGFWPRLTFAAVSAEVPEGHTRMTDGITPSEPTEWLEALTAASAETRDDDE